MIVVGSWQRRVGGGGGRGYGGPAGSVTKYYVRHTDKERAMAYKIKQI